MGVIEYARKILSDHNCNEYTYGGEESKKVLDDLKEGYPNGMEYPYLCVANAILAISKPELIKKKPYLVVWNTDSCCDGFYADSFEHAKADMEDLYIEWETQETFSWKDILNPSEEQIENWDYMIDNCYCHIDKYNFETDEYEEYYYPSDEELRKIGWDEWEVMKEIIKEAFSYE